jgi:hypothetical protein
MLLLSREQIVHLAVRPTIFGNMMPASFGKAEHQRRNSDSLTSSNTTQGTARSPSLYSRRHTET